MKTSKSLPPDVMGYQSEFQGKMMPPLPFWVGGSDRHGESGAIHSVFNPAEPAQVVGQCYQLTPKELPRVLVAAEKSFEDFRHSPPSQRVEILANLARLIEKHEDALATLITREAGKPLTLSRNEVARASAVCQMYAEEVPRTGPLTVYADNRQGRVQYFPLGPVLAITPFNFPLNLAVHKLAPAIAAGCSITIKPAPQTPLTALYLAKLAAEAGYSAISVTPCTNEIAQELVLSDVFKKLSFTGSTHIGWHLKALAPKKSTTLELGGNAAVVIDEFTEPVWEIAQRVAFGAFAYAGQICISVQRILIRDALLEEFMEHFKNAVRSLRVGDPMDPKTVIGPLISVEQVQRSRNWISDAIKHGGNVVYGGNTYNLYMLNPTVIDRVNPDMLLMQEECFAPLVSVEAYSTFEEALAKVNDSRYGLQAGVYANPIKAEQAFRTLEVGGVIMDDVPTFRADRLPYGGVKDSGIGREGVMSGIADMSYVKTLVQKM